MALLANGAEDRAEQLLIITNRLTELIGEEHRRMDVRQPPLDGAAAEERNRLANAYRLELSRIKLDPALIDAAPGPLLAKLRAATARFQETLMAHETALGALKAVSEGLVQAMAEEVTRQRGGASHYGAQGALAAQGGPKPALFDRNA
jgi:hypothetical protein